MGECDAGGSVTPPLAPPDGAVAIGCGAFRLARRGGPIAIAIELAFSFGVDLLVACAVVGVGVGAAAVGRVRRCCGLTDVRPPEDASDDGTGTGVVGVFGGCGL